MRLMREYVKAYLEETGEDSPRALYKQKILTGVMTDGHYSCKTCRDYFPSNLLQGQNL